jgi:hypothetical protein
LNAILSAYDAAFRLIPERFDSLKAKQELLTIAKQESNWADRWQVIDRNRPNVKGPARGLLQFELGGAVKGVMTHRACRAYARQAVAAAGVAWNAREIWVALETHDDLALALGRVLLLSDPRPLPGIGDVKGAWDCYVRNWRPGKPHPKDWPENYEAAAELIKGAS